MEEHSYCYECRQKASFVSFFGEEEGGGGGRLLIPVAFERRDIHPRRLGGGALLRDCGDVADSAIWR